MYHSHRMPLVRPFTYHVQYFLQATMTLAALCGITLSNAYAVDFEFDMGRDSTMPSINTDEAFPMVCGAGRSEVNQEACDGDDINNANNGSQPWINELVRDDNNNQYFHMVVGLPTDDFMQEVYIRIGSSNFSWSEGETRAPSNSGGHLGIGKDSNDELGNASDPLGKTHDNTYSGAGTANPIHVLMKQVLKSDASSNPNTNGSKGDFYQEFDKTAFTYAGTDINANKPKIIQTLSHPGTQDDMSMVFIADMSAISYSNDGSPLTVSNNTGASGVMVNTLTFTGTGEAANFDMSTDSEAGNATPTAGRFIFTPGTGSGGTGWVDTSTYDRGTYTYFEDSYDQFAIDYSTFCDPSQIKNYGAGADNNGC